MRFKTRLRPDRIPQFVKICQALERVDRTCILSLCGPQDEYVRLVVHADAAASLSCFTCLSRQEWFDSYRIESQNNNQIGLELDINNLLRALRSATAADYILVKLTKKGLPVLTFEISTPLGPILQDIPVAVLSAVRLAEYQEPQHEQTIGLALPPLNRLHTMVDRMKALSQTLYLDAELRADNSGLALRVTTDMVSVSTNYRGLSVATIDQDEGMDESRQHNLTAIVDMKNFSRCLYGHSAQPNHALCFIHQSCVMLHLMLPCDATITYYIPRRTPPT